MKKTLQPEVLGGQEEQKQRSELEAKALNFLELAEGMTVTNNDQFQRADEFNARALKHKKEIEAHFKPIKKAQDDAKRIILDKEKAAIAPIEMGRDILKRKMIGYQREQERERKRRDAEAAEKRRKEMEERRAIEQKKRDAEAEALAAQGKEEDGVALLDKPLPVDEAPPVAPVAPSTVPKHKTVIREKWTFKIEDESAIPREYMVPDLKTIGAYGRAKKNKAEIPGVRFFDENEIS
ncbi:MAG: hypothetical protein GWM98_11660 [Nitrospinaceae bacterium]|nr:hypothetical protein [Nitrospinaceae bacterium]NIR55040.1 hypothetical protein [Nitrospinaceae bacterium]NIS85439.1 hypothetical protein [Nitrospinaceae bacterium]NIT82278.1 hypothetical protein [Nitrospinaceae bacterium]NIU44509.1 hypothetical protein [Nitrospinaceae bacterium]